MVVFALVSINGNTRLVLMSMPRSPLSYGENAVFERDLINCWSAWVHAVQAWFSWRAADYGWSGVSICLQMAPTHWEQCRYFGCERLQKADCVFSDLRFVLSMPAVAISAGRCF